MGFPTLINLTNLTREARYRPVSGFFFFVLGEGLAAGPHPGPGSLSAPARRSDRGGREGGSGRSSGTAGWEAAQPHNRLADHKGRTERGRAGQHDRGGAMWGIDDSGITRQRGGCAIAAASGKERFGRMGAITLLSVQSRHLATASSKERFGRMGSKRCFGCRAGVSRRQTERTAHRIGWQGARNGSRS